MKLLGSFSLLFIFVFGILLLLGDNYYYQGDLSSFQGYLHSTEDGQNIYIEDLESGNYVALKFAFDRAEDLDFSDIEFVEVVGYYNTKNNVLEVELLQMVSADLVTKIDF